MGRLRILGLHGCGTSAAIWEAQSQSFRQFLPPEWSFDFVDGSVECIPPEDIAPIYPGPYFCHYDVPTFEHVELAHRWIHEVLEEDGPFDAVMGFSQGAALAASLILHHQDENPFASPLFRFAVFFNGSLPFSKSANLGVDFSHIWEETAKDEAGKPYTPTDSDDTTTTVPSMAEDDPLRSLPMRRFSPRTHKDKIGIPTAHLYGKHDPWRMQSLRLRDICDGQLASFFEHSGAHNVPRAEGQSSEIAKTILKTAQKAEFITV